jgi:beta-lactamase superfamily II metal-dependent hydrolase
VLRTDRNGAVTVSTDGSDLRVHSARERRSRVIMGPTSPNGG